MQRNKSCSACTTAPFKESIKETSFWRQKEILKIFSAGVVLLAGLYLEFLTEYRFFAQILFIIVVLIAGYEIIKNGILSLLKGRFNINFLITLAATGAFLIGHGEEGAAVIFLFFIAEFLEEYAAGRARRSIAALLEMAPETATLKKNGKELVIPVEEINIGDIIIVKPGDRIPLDGVVVEGRSYVNQAPITGESIPVLKEENSDVFAGTINEEGYLEIKVTKKSDETMLSKITKLVMEAQAQKSKTEAFIDRFARYYTPAVIFLAALTVAIPTFAGYSFEVWLYRGLVLLVISCPCALAISTPVSMVSAITSASRHGVLIKGRIYVEEIRNVKALVFDKTGTLTEGKLEVTDVIALNGNTEVLEIAASLESKSKHPIAQAIVRKAEENKVRIKNISQFESIAGKGLRGEINGSVFYVGNRELIRDGSPVVEKLEREGKTVILVAKENQVIGVIALRDKIRKESFELIRKLKKRNIRTIMLTGDNHRVAEAIAKELGIDEFYANLLPEDKSEKIEMLLEKYGHVAMVGDGVNDAPALAKAHVGIAMGAIGSDVAIETADIALMQDDLSKVDYLIALSNKTMSVVNQNVLASILIKGSFAILTFPGIVTLWLAVAVGDMGLSLAVILNALRIGRVN
jgi:Cd2+/Zn2+-exporting ATPase